MKILKIDWTPSMRWGLGFSNSRTSPFEQVEQLSAFLRREACVKSSFPTYLRCCSFNDTNCVSTSSFPSICSTLQVKMIAKVNRCNKLKKLFAAFTLRQIVRWCAAGIMWIDTLLLLNHLRTAKFSQLRARTLVENCAKTFTNYPHWFRDIDTHDPVIMEPFEAEYDRPC